MAPTSPSSQGSEDSTSRSTPLDSPASDKSRTAQPVQQSLPDTGPMSPDGEMSTSSTLLPTPKAHEAGWNSDGRQDPAHRPYQDGQHRTWGVKQVIQTLLPTPTVGDASQSGHRQEQRTPTSHDGMTLSDWSRGRMSSSGDTHASPSAKRAGEADPTTRATSGLSSPVLLASFDPATRSWRTFQATFLSEELPSLPTLPRSGMTRHGQLFELQMSAHHTDASDGSASLRTPTAQEKNPGGGGELRAQIMLGPDRRNGSGTDHWGRPNKGRLPTPAARDYRHHTDLPREGGPSLPSEINSLLPTPRVSDQHGTGRHGTGGMDLRTAVNEKLLPTPEAWLGRRPSAGQIDPTRVASRRHKGDRGRRSTTLPEALGSIGEPTPPQSPGGSK